MEYIVTENVDYLAFTLKIPRIFFNDKGYANIKSPNTRYDMCEQAESGALHMWHTRHERMGHHYIYAGKPLEYLRAKGFDEREIVKWCLEKSAISRIDIAITSQPESENDKHGFAPHAIAWACRDLMLKSRLMPDKDVSENTKTQTKYIGSRKSRNRLFRAYDKGIEQGLVPNFLIRYELETQKGTKTIARAIVANEPYGAIIKRYVDFPTIRTYQQIMNAPVATMRHVEQLLGAREMDETKALSRWSWLQTSIPATIQKALSEDFHKFGIDPQTNEQFQLFIHKVLATIDKV